MDSQALWQAILLPKPLMSDQAAFSAEDTQQIVLLRALRTAGISTDELRHLLDVLQSDISDAEKTRHLRRVRYDLLARLHEQQRTLDALDQYVTFLKQG